MQKLYLHVHLILEHLQEIVIVELVVMENVHGYQEQLVLQEHVQELQLH